MREHLTSYIPIYQHMAGGILITKCRKEYLTWEKKMYEDTGLLYRGSLYFNRERLYFDANKDDQLDNGEDIYMVDTRASL